MDIDFREEFDLLAKQYGIDVLYVRASKHATCKCYKPLYKVGDPKCPYCAGTGKVTIIEKITGISQNVNVFMQLNNYKVTEIGKVYTELTSFFVRYDVAPKVGDMIYFVGWSKNTPNNIIKVFEIGGIKAVNGDNGRIEYYILMLKQRPDLADIAQKQIIVKSHYHFKKGNRYLWGI